MRTWLRAHVVVDAANLSYRMAGALAGLGGLVPGPRLEPDLTEVRASLARFGIDVLQFEVALPLEPVTQLGVVPDERRRARIVASARAWLAAQQASLGAGSVVELRGATDGHGEIGVDGLCVLASLRAAWRDDVEAVVVLSQDWDVMIAQDFAADTPIYLASWFPPQMSARLKRSRRNWIDLGAEGLAAMAPRDRRAAPIEEPSLRIGTDPQDHLRLWCTRTGRARSSDLAAWAGCWLDDRRRAVDGAGVVAVTDPYGLSRAAARAIGVGKLPTPSTVESLLFELGWDGPVAQLAAVPDIVDRLRIEADFGEPWRRAVRDRDDELDLVFAAHRDDGDARTHATRGQVYAARRDRDGLPVRALEEKQVVSILLADVAWALTDTDLPVVVLSDRAELTYLLEQLDVLGIDHHDRLTRIGLHPRPFTPVATAPEPGRQLLDADDLALLTAVRDRLAHEPPTDETVELVVLNGRLTAQLMGLNEQLYGAALVAAVHAELADPTVAWRLVRYDPESQGAIISPVERADVEVVFRRMLELDDDVARRLEAGTRTVGADLQLSLTYDPTAACSAPALRSQPGQSSTAAGVATVIAHRDGAVRLDLDGDGDPDVDLDAGSHDPDAYEIGRPVVVQRLSSSARGLRLVGPTGSVGDPDAGVPIVVTATGLGQVSHPDSGVTGPLLDIVGARDLRYLPNQRLLAFAHGDGSFQAISSALSHLQGS